MSRNDLTNDSPAFYDEAEEARRAEHECNVAALQSDADYADMIARRDREQREAQMEYDATCREMADGMSLDLPVLRPVTATCRAVPQQPWQDLKDAFEKPVRTVAQRVAEHSAQMFGGGSCK